MLCFIILYQHLLGGRMEWDFETWKSSITYLHTRNTLTMGHSQALMNQRY